MATPDVVGFQFTVRQDVFVDSLGILDRNFGTGAGPIQHTHEVGIWRFSDGTLLASASVGPGGTLVSGFRYESISTITLLANVEYVAGATYWTNAGTGDSYVSTPASATYDPDLSHIGAMNPTMSNLGFVMPTVVSAGNRGRFGPNFNMTPVPEPASLLVLGPAALIALARRRRRN